MNLITLKFSVAPSVADRPMTVTARLNGQVFFQKQIDQCYQCEHSFDEDATTNNVLELELSNKTTEHTRINDQGQILEDSLIYIKNIEFENINIDQVIYETSSYTHDFNGTQPKQTLPFYGVLGCNGTVKFEFSSPFYHWPLQHI